MCVYVGGKVVHFQVTIGSFYDPSQRRGKAKPRPGGGGKEPYFGGLGI